MFYSFDPFPRMQILLYTFVVYRILYIYTSKEIYLILFTIHGMLMFSTYFYYQVTYSLTQMPIVIAMMHLQTMSLFKSLTPADV